MAVVAREDRPADRPRDRVQRLRRAARSTASASSSSVRRESVRCRRHAARRRLARRPRRTGRSPVIWSPAASHVGRDPQPAPRRPGRERHRAAPGQVRSCSRRSSSPCPSRWPRRSASPTTPIGFADILALAKRPRGLGRPTATRVGPVPARQDQPELLDQRAVGVRSPSTTRRPARPADLIARTSTDPSVERVRRGRRVGRRPLRRHHADVPQQPGTAPTSGATSLTYASAVAVEEKSVIDYNRGNPDGVLDPGEEPATAAGPARRDLPGGGHALLRQPVLRPRRRRG